MGTLLARIVAAFNAFVYVVASLSSGQAFQTASPCDTKVALPRVGTRTSPIAVALVGLPPVAVATLSLSNIARPTGFLVPSAPSLLMKAFQAAIPIAFTASWLAESYLANSRRVSRLTWSSLLPPVTDLATSLMATCTQANGSVACNVEPCRRGTATAGRVWASLPMSSSILRKS
jgi:hypothetical protein